MNIIIVEDEQRARRGLSNLITSISEDYEVISTVSDGKKALEIIQVVKPDVVFTDIKMPYMNGLSLIKAVNSMEIKTKFVIISAYEEFETARQAISLGVEEYLVKPVTYDETKKVLKRLSLDNNISIKESLKNLQKKYPDVHPIIIKALNVIENSYAAKINQEELAQDLGVTQEYFSYLFHKEIGETFSSFLRNYRIQVAKSLLLNKGIPKDEVPYSVGFSDYKYFNKVFKKVTGETVPEFLRNNR